MPQEPKCNCLADGSPNPAARCPVHHPLDPSRPDIYLRTLYAGHIKHRHVPLTGEPWVGDPKDCPHCRRLEASSQR